MKKIRERSNGSLNHSCLTNVYINRHELSSKRETPFLALVWWIITAHNLSKPKDDFSEVCNFTFRIDATLKEKKEFALCFYLPLQPYIVINIWRSITKDAEYRRGTKRSYHFIYRVEGLREAKECLFHLSSVVNHPLSSLFYFQRLLRNC